MSFLLGGMVLGALFGGDKEKSVTRQTVRNAITTSLKNEVQNINKILLKNTVDVTNKVVSKVEANIIQSASSANIFSGRDIIISGKGKFKLNQSSTLKYKAEASQKIIHDNNVRNDLQTEITNSVLNNTLNNNDIISKLTALNDLLSRKTDEGGEHIITDAIDSIVGIFKGPKTVEKEVEQKIDNILNTLVENKTINQNEVQNIIESKVQNIIENITQASCNQLMTTTNTFYARDIIITDDGQFDASQTAIGEAMALCINSATNNVDIANAIIQNNKSIIDNTTENENKVDSNMDVKNILKEIDEKTSIINGLWKMIIIVAIVIGICVVIGAIAGVIYVSKGGKIPSLKNNLPGTPLSPPQALSTEQYVLTPPLYNFASPGSDNNAGYQNVSQIDGSLLTGPQAGNAAGNTAANTQLNLFKKKYNIYSTKK